MTAIGSVPGCILFVKLWQFDRSDRTQVEIDTGAKPYRPTAGRPGVEFIPLFSDSREEVRLERWAPGAAIKMSLPGGARCWRWMAISMRPANASRCNPGCGSRSATRSEPRLVWRAARSG